MVFGKIVKCLSPLRFAVIGGMLLSACGDESPTDGDQEQALAPEEVEQEATERLADQEPVAPEIISRGEVSKLPDQSKQSIVKVVSGTGRRATFATGFVIADQFVLTTEDAVRYEDSIFVTSLADGETYSAVLEFEDRRRRLAVLRVAGLNAPALNFAKGPLQSGREVFSLGYTRGQTANAQTTVESTTGTISDFRRREIRSGELVDFIRHNALIKSLGYGSPLMNNCGEVMGINVPDPGLETAEVRRNLGPSGIVFALHQRDLIAILSGADLSVPAQQASTQCPTSTEIAAAKTKFEEDRVAYQELLRQEIETINEEQSQQVADLTAKRARDQQTIIIIIGLALVIVLVLAVVIVRNRSKARQREEEAQQRLAERERAVSEEKARASKAEQQAAAARDNLNELNQVLEGMASVYLDGHTANRARPVSLVLPGHELVKTGAIIGRASGDGAYSIDDDSVSRKHARLTMSRDNPVCMLEDMNSTNGTKVNGKTLEPNTPHPLGTGDIIEVGGCVFNVQIK